MDIDNKYTNRNTHGPQEDIVIPLWEALLILVYHLEKLQNVSDKDRIGHPRPGYSSAPKGAQVIATGPLFSSSFRPLIPPPRRDRKTGRVLFASKQSPRLVPAQPTREQLEILLNDHNENLNITTDCEKRLCTAHNILKNSIINGIITVQAIQELIPCDGGDVIEKYIETAPKSHFSDSIFDYYECAIYTNILEEINYQNYKISVDIIYFNVSIKYDELCHLLSKDYQEIDAVNIKINKVKQNYEYSWIISDGSFKVEISSLNKPLELGMSSLKTLLNNIGSPICYYLLDGVLDRGHNTRPQVNATGSQNYEKMKSERSVIYPISINLFNGNCSLKDSHKLLSEKLNEITNIKWDENNFTKDEVRVKLSNKLKSYRESQNSVRKSIKAALEEMMRHGKEGYLLAKLINSCLTFPGATACFEKKICETRTKPIKLG